MRDKLKAVIAEYGALALSIYLSTVALVALSVISGLDGKIPSTVIPAELGTFAAFFVVAKLTQPARIALTLVLTPIVSRLLRRSEDRSPEKFLP